VRCYSAVRRTAWECHEPRQLRLVRGVRQPPNQGLNAGERTQARVCHAACGRPGRASCQPRACFALIERSVAPCHRPVTRPVTTGRNSVRVSSLARARSSHRANRDRRNPAPAAAAAWPEPKPHGIPAATPKRFSPPPFKKRSRVAAPSRTVFNSPRAHPLSPALRSELKTDRP
jgi:hypothetical protein